MNHYAATLFSKPIRYVRVIDCLVEQTGMLSLLSLNSGITNRYAQSLYIITEQCSIIDNFEDKKWIKEAT